MPDLNHVQAEHPAFGQQLKAIIESGKVRLPVTVTWSAATRCASSRMAISAVSAERYGSVADILAWIADWLEKTHSPT